MGDLRGPSVELVVCSRTHLGVRKLLILESFLGSLLMEETTVGVAFEAALSHARLRKLTGYQQLEGIVRQDDGRNNVT